jgi:hypothetical protein
MPVNGNIWGYCEVNNKVFQKAIERLGFEFVSYEKISKLIRIVRVLEKV